jgi:hypothetical protein
LAKKNLASCIFIVVVYLNFLGSQQKVGRHKHSVRAPMKFKFKNDKVRVKRHQTVALEIHI